jgi:alpha-tubulin suppressor-like RCC1 family protein
VVLRILAQGGAIPASRADVAAIRAAISRPAGGYAVRYRDAKGYRGGNPSDTCHEPLLNVGPAPAPVREPTLTLAFDEAPGLERTALAVTLRNEGDLPEELTVVARDTHDGAALPSVDLAVEPATCASYTLTLDESAAPVAWRNIEAAAVSRNGEVYPATSRTSAAYARSAKLSAGGAHTCWLDGERQLWCWGNNDRGQLARDPSEGAVALTPILIEGPLAMSPFEDARELAAGEAHTCLRTSLGRVACWGNNDHGQLGDGTALGRFVPAPIAGLVGVAQIVAGSAHTCALLADRTARCWGKNDRGQLGTGDTAGRSSPAAVAGLGEIQWLAAGDAQTCAVVHDGTVRCWGTAGPLSSLTPAPVAGLGSVTEVALGARHGCARTAAGKVRCWGGNDHGQLGNNSWRDSVVPVAVDELANLVVSQLEIGWQHSCAREPGGIRCWGDNAWGQIGDDSTMTTKVPEKVKMPAGFDGADVRQAAAGAYHGCFAGLGAASPAGETTGRGSSATARSPTGRGRSGSSGSAASSHRRRCATPVRRVANHDAISSVDDPDILGRMAAPDAVSDGLELVDQFKIMRLLGRGAMAEVFLARDLRLGRKVALKLIRPQAHVTAEQVLREAQATARFSHPNIVSIYGVGEHAGRPYLALEYVEGDTLRLRLAGERPGLREAVRFALAIAEALREAHRHGVLHRDLKPENILCGKDGRLRVLDFGLALLERPAPGRPAHGGTPAYMAPELWRGDEPTTASDLWSFGVVLHELIHGVRVYDEPSFTLLSARLRSLEPAPVAPDPAGLPDEVGRLLRACLDKRAAGRPSADDAVRVLGAALSERPTAEPGQEATPFRGLASFTSEHAAFFFGREAEVAAALERLRGQPVLPIVGFSGAGKSSLVKAGIVPRLLEQGAWTVLELRPGRQPFHALARRLAAVAPLSRETAGTLLTPGGDAPPRERTDVDLDELAARLAAEPRLLAALLREVAAATRGKLFLFVDQLEELYTLGASAEDRARFLAALCGAADDPQDPVRVCFTVRDDFLGRLAESAALEQVLVLGSPAPDALGAILTRPLEHLGYRYDDPTIVDEMVGAIRGEHAGLPLLSFAARLLWERRDPERRVLCRSAYDAMGGVAGAIADHAERLLDGLSEREIGWVKRILLRLVTPERTRRIVAREDLLLDLPAEAGSLIDRLVDARLLTVRREVELAHESLIVRWSRLARWLDEGREELVFVAQAEQAAQLWHRRGRRVAELWSGDALLEARRVAGRTALALPPVARDFLAASERHERGRRNRRRVVWAAAASGLALLAAGASVAALAFAEKNAESRRRLAESHREAAGAALDRGSLVEARARLRTALEIDDATGARGLWWRLRSTPRHGRIALLGVGAIAFSPDSRSLLVSSEGSAVLTYHDVATLAERNVSRDLDGGVPAATHAGEGHVLFGGRAGQVAVVTLESGRTRYLAGLRSAECHLPGQGCGNHPPAHHGSTLAVFSSANASRLVSVGTDAVVNVWSLDGRATGRLVLREVPTAAALTPDGTRLVVTSPSSAEVQLWNLDTGELARSLTAAAAGGRVAVSPDGPALVWGGGDGIVQVFPLDGAEPRTWRTRHARVTALAVSSDGKYLVTGGDRTAQLWRLADGVAVEAFGTELDGIHELALAPDGSLLAVATRAASSSSRWTTPPSRRSAAGTATR